MLTLTILAALSAASRTQPIPTPAAEVGSITGHVTWEGDRPEPKADLVIDEKAAVGCKHESMHKQDESLIIDAKGGVANVVLTVEVAGAPKPAPTEPIELDQEGCHFSPHVLVVPAGAMVRFANSDEASHNIHPFPKKNAGWNKNVGPGTNIEEKFDKAEVIDVKCDIHPWMKGYIVVTDATHWATSAADGSFTIEGLPPGEYELSWWHEELGKGKTAKVTVEAGKAATLDHKVSAEKKASTGRRR